MIYNRSIWTWRGLIVPFIVLAVLFAPQVALANVRVGNGGDVPFYARVERGLDFTDGRWVAVVFYRPPACIPAGFNLLDFFDFVDAWFCGPAATDGFSIWNDGAAPIQQELHGLGAVPVWFVSLADYQLAIADDVLTIGELGGLASLKTGSASFYQETLHPTGGAPRAHLEYNAHGTLSDGAAFRVHAVLTEAHFRTSIHFGR